MDQDFFHVISWFSFVPKVLVSWWMFCCGFLPSIVGFWRDGGVERRRRRR